MRARLHLWVLLLICPFDYGQVPVAPNTDASSQPLAIRIGTPPQWKKHCLQISVTRANRSKLAIFLPSFGGLLVYSSVTDASNTLGQGSGVAWFLVEGMSDIIDRSVSRRAGRNGIPIALQTLFPLLIQRGRSGDKFGFKELSAFMPIIFEKHLIGR